MRTFNSEDIKKILISIRNVMEQNKNFLIELDSALGDGDLGLTMCAGFNSIVDGFKDSEDKDIGVLLSKAGLIMADSAASTMGTLVATAIMRAGGAVKGLTEISAKEFAEMGEASINGIKMRGKAELGDKTILDSLIPAVSAIRENIAPGIPLEIIFKKAYMAALEGVENTKNMKARHGRAGWYGEKSIGHQDPGATVGMLIMKAVCIYIESVGGGGLQ